MSEKKSKETLETIKQIAEIFEIMKKNVFDKKLEKLERLEKYLLKKSELLDLEAKKIEEINLLEGQIRKLDVKIDALDKEF